MKKSSLLLLFFIVLFIINPFLTLVCLSAYLINNRNLDFNLIKCTCILLAIFAGCINSTKIIEDDPDLSWYTAGYLDAGHKPFLEYLLTFGLTGTGREFTLPFFNYLVYFIAGDSLQLYLILCGTTTYALLNFAVYRYAKALNFPPYIIILGIFVMTFLPYIFTLSAAVMRQFFAASILMYVLISRIFYNKKCWILMVLMVLTHASTLFFVPLLFIKFFKKPLAIKTIIIYLVGVVGIVFIQQIADVLLTVFSENSVIGYAIKRASQDTTFELEPLSPMKILTAIVMVCSPLYIIYLKKSKLKIETSSAIYFYNILLMLVFFILVNLRQAELTVRYNFFVWLYFPFVFIFVANYLKLNKLICLSIILFLMVFFIAYLDIGVWKYTIGFKFLYYSLLNYII